MKKETQTHKVLSSQKKRPASRDIAALINLINQKNVHYHFQERICNYPEKPENFPTTLQLRLVALSGGFSFNSVLIFIMTSLDELLHLLSLSLCEFLCLLLLLT